MESGKAPTGGMYKAHRDELLQGMSSRCGGKAEDCSAVQFCGWHCEWGAVSESVFKVGPCFLAFRREPLLSVRKEGVFLKKVMFRLCSCLHWSEDDVGFWRTRHGCLVSFR